MHLLSQELIVCSSHVDSYGGSRFSVLDDTLLQNRRSCFFKSISSNLFWVLVSSIRVIRTAFGFKVALDGLSPS